MYVLDMDDTFIEFPHDPVIICYRGSHAHGTYVPPEDETGVDDVDLFGICAPTLDHYFGNKKWDGKDFWVENYDIVTYSFSKFVHLLGKGNPNCVGILWTLPEHRFYTSPLGQKLIDHRDIFLGKETVVASFKGYAAGQMHKMTHFFTQAYYDELEEMRRELAMLSIEDGTTHDDIPASCVEARQLLSKYNKLKKKLYAGYMGEKRKKLVDQFGYDTKNASHLIRLLTMCVELLDTCELNVFRTNDAQTFIDIKKGQWTLDQVSQRAEELFALIREKYDACPLPELPDYERINSLTTQWLKEYYLES